MNYFILIYLAICAGLGFASYSLARNKGYNPAMAAGITGLAALISFWIAGLVCLVIYACLRPNHRYCPKCGEPNIHYLTRCRRCDHPLPAP